MTFSDPEADLNPSMYRSVFLRRIFIQIESHPEKELFAAVGAMIPTCGVRTPKPHRLSAGGRRIVMITSLIEAKINAIIPGAIKNKPFCRSITILPEIQKTLFK